MQPKWLVLPMSLAVLVIMVPVTTTRGWTYKDEYEVRMYLQFKREWQQCVASGKTEEWQLMYLNKRTPDIIYLSNCVLVAEAWSRLDDNYANPIVVCTELVGQFYKFKVTATSKASKLVEIEHKLTNLYKDLYDVGQSSQVMDNPHLLSQVV